VENTRSDGSIRSSLSQVVLSGNHGEGTERVPSSGGRLFSRDQLKSSTPDFIVAQVAYPARHQRRGAVLDMARLESLRFSSDRGSKKTDTGRGGGYRVELGWLNGEETNRLIWGSTYSTRKMSTALFSLLALFFCLFFKLSNFT